ncbi:helix-turn-helix domain-containing protein [Bifidobacterium sp. ESL0704]|uniref:helix-turn-helix domain-containing protein n=1 Tax=Bifidobacterium sp. ESL0704 TaxID=2983219 RepID=UPI0023F70852|nr:helix-turn-helix domain-containing protein [Bifidobacterium sp. ESL0704]WEV53793.1 helix-turn-helix domain-containing protein [Bifidobacterium sp. ESL0704]
MFGVHPPAISRKMLGKTDWNLRDIAKAAHFFNVRPEKLVAGSGFEPETSGL